ncbi:MAG: SAM-dependent methyltransferase [Burkholderiaceae bacterium]|jgi:hypothetical protein|nr:SAM-dependent methyltransferase [Burkholderiaceae bacterium]
MNAKHAHKTAGTSGSVRPEAVASALAELRPGQSIELLKELHILTRDGRINQDSRRKLKQVEHLAQFIEQLIASITPYGPALTLADHGAGKSYLGFILYDRLWGAPGASGAADAPGTVYGIETRPELVEHSRALAARLGFAHMRFLNIAAADAARAEGLPERIDLVTALHACDTATDDAIAFALEKQAQTLALVPCCQAEVAACLRQSKALQLARSPLAELWRRPLHTREIGSQLTNVLRCLYLESQGYQVTVTELVGWEHSLKNELILAHRTGNAKHSAGQRLRALLAEFGLQALLPLRYPRLTAADAEAGNTDRA